MIVALTGGTGFVGGHTLTALLAAGHDVRALTRRAQPERADVAWVHGALDNPPSLAELCRGADAVVHVAGVTNAPDAAGFDAGNRLGTAAMLDAAHASGVRRFVHVSSLAAREPQLSLYGASKRAAEDAVTASALDWQVVRPPAIYGPGDTDNLELFKFARRGIIPLPPGGRLSVVHAADLARLFVALVEASKGQCFYEADDARPGGWSHREYALAIGAAVGRRPLLVPLPRPLVSLGARIDMRLRGPHAKLTLDRVAYFCHPDWTIDPAKRPPTDFWHPKTETMAGLAATATWYHEHNWL